MNKRIRKLLRIPPPIQIIGAIDAADGISLHGWATTNRHQPVQVDIAVDGAVLGSVACNLFREDLKNNAIGDGRHGFSMAIPTGLLDGGTHVVTAHVSTDKGRHLLDKIKLTFAVSSPLEQHLLPEFLRRLKTVTSLSQKKDAVAIVAGDCHRQTLSAASKILATLGSERPAVIFAFATDEAQIPQAADGSETADNLIAIPYHQRERYLESLCDAGIRFDEIWLSQTDFGAVQLAKAISHANTRVRIQTEAPDALADATAVTSRALSHKMAVQQLSPLPIETAKESRFFQWTHADAGGGKSPDQNILLVWKQHDAGLYGRRVDQIARALLGDGFRVTCLEIMVPAQLKQYMAGATDAASDYGFILHDFYQKRHGCKENGIQYKTLYMDEQTPPMHAIQTCLMENRILPTNSVAIVFPAVPHWVSVLKALEPYTKICDVVDNQLAWTPQQPSELLTQYETSIAASDATVFNSAKNAQYFRDLNYLANKPVLEIPNWYVLPKQFTATPTPQSQRDGVINLIYSGNMNDRMDWPLVKKVATKLPFPVRVHLVGNGQNAQAELVDCLAIPCVTYHGPLRESALLALLQRCDVAIMPHLNDDCSGYMNPLKVHMYAALGIPCVSTSVAGVDFSSAGIFEGNTHDAFIQHVTDLGRNTMRSSAPRTIRRQVGDCGPYVELVRQLLKG